MSDIRPLQNKIFVKRIKQEVKSSIFLTDDTYFKGDYAEVNAVGPQSELQVGDIVLIGKFSGQIVKHEDETYLQMTDDDVIGIVENNAIRALKDFVIFTWIDEIEKEQEYTRSGLIIQRKLDQNRARWGVVYAVGPKVYTVKPEQYILPEKTYDYFGGQFKLDGEDNPLVEMWKLHEDDIVVMSEDVTVTYGLNNECEVQELVKYS